MGDTIYIAKGSERFGPLTFEEVKKQAKEGRLLMGDYVWIPEQKKWVLVEKIPQLVSLIEQYESGQIRGLEPISSDNGDSFYLWTGKKSIGPISKDELIGMVKVGRISAGDPVFHQGTWIRAKEALGSQWPQEQKPVVEIKAVETHPIAEVEPKETAKPKSAIEPRTISPKKSIKRIPGQVVPAEELFKDQISSEPLYRQEMASLEQDDRSFFISFAFVSIFVGLFITSAFYVRLPEIEEQQNMLPEKVAELMVPDEDILSELMNPTNGTGEGEGAGGGSGGGSGGGTTSHGSGGSGMGPGPTGYGVLGLITTDGGSGGVVDILGSSSGGDFDSIIGGIGGLKTGGISSIGGGGGGGLGLGGGGGGGLDSLIGMLGSGGGGGGGFEMEVSGGVTLSVPSGISGEGSADANRSSAIIREVIERHRSGLEYIYKKYLKTNPTLQGKVVVSFTISASGRVTNAYLISSTLGNPTMESEIATAVYGWSFPAITKGDTVIIYPFVFFTSK